MTDSSNEPWRQQPAPTPGPAPLPTAGQVPPPPPLPPAQPPYNAAQPPYNAAQPPFSYNAAQSPFNPHQPPFAPLQPGYGQPHGQLVTSATPQGYPQPAKPRNKWLLPVLAVVAGLVIAGSAVAVTLALTSGDGAPVAADTPTTSPTPAVADSAQPTPSPTKTASPTPSATPKSTPSPQPTITVNPQPEPSASVPEQPAPDADAPTVPDRSSVVVSAETVGGEIQQVLDQYAAWDESGELWTLIEHTEKNTYGYLAFRFLISDLKAATIFGVSDASAKDYWSRVMAYEEKLLAEQPLGDDVTIDSDKSYFHYDGTTGEGEYRKK